jgi:hypothetical protein
VRAGAADPSEAAELWEVLLVIVSEIRPAGGSVDIGLLSARLQRRFALRERPDYESDWTLLRSVTERNMAQVPDSLAGGLRLDRAEILAQIEEAMRGARLVALVGPSGSGKTALAKAYGTACEDSVIVWLRAKGIAALTAPGGALCAIGFSTRCTPRTAQPGSSSTASTGRSQRPPTSRWPSS